jgi:ribosome recycling factor
MDMKIHTDVDSIRGSIQDLSIKERKEVAKEATKVQKEPRDIVEISKENMAASLVKIESAEAAAELLRRIQAQIEGDPMGALLAQANITSANLTGLIE